MSSKHFIGVDLGGTKILAGVFDSNLKCLVSDKNKTKAVLGYSGVKERIVETIKGSLHLAGIKISSVKGVGIGAPGTISKDGEKVLEGAKAFLLLWKKIPKYRFLYIFFKLPIIFSIFSIVYEIIAFFLYFKNRKQLKN